MDPILALLAAHPMLVIIVLAAVALWLTVCWIPNNRVGVVEKLWDLNGSVRHGIIALRGEAGYQPRVLRGGLHFMFRLQFRIHIVPLVTIPQGKIGYVFARDGERLSSTQTLACNVTAGDFQDVDAFLQNGGQRGPQRLILREGTYPINLAQFVVLTQETVYYLRLNRQDDEMFSNMAGQIAQRDGFKPLVITEDLVGIVTVMDGPSLPPGELVAPIVGDDRNDSDTYHNNFQDPEKFLAAGGKRGRQLQVVVEGTYYINRLFATVELIPKTVVEVGWVGVVVSYTGDQSADLSGEEYKHGELVSVGSRGVWSEALKAGKYAFNTYAGRIIKVPTTNFILKWDRNDSGDHKFDENLKEISLITKDAFEPLLPLSVVVHIDYRKAPLVIQRFGEIKRLVDQTLDPMVSAYFKNVAQTRTVIQLIHDRISIQQIASEEMKEKFEHYNLELEEVLIGTPETSGDSRIEDILTQLRLRQIAEEQIETYARQQKASVQERELREAEARARQQASITESELSIQVQSNQGKADYHRALQQAEQIRALADAEASKMKSLAEGEAARVRALAEAEAARIEMVGRADADKTARVGVAQAVAVEEQVRAYGGPRFQLTQQVMSRFAEAIEKGRVEMVPRIMVGNGASGGNGVNGAGTLIEVLLSMMLSDRVGDGGTGGNSSGDGERRAEADALRSQIKEALAAVKPPAAG